MFFLIYLDCRMLDNWSFIEILGDIWSFLQFASISNILVDSLLGIPRLPKPIFVGAVSCLSDMG
jgi:hypothetical protein